MYKAHITLGIAPVKRERLPIPPALEQKNRLMSVISKIKPENVTLVTLDDICPNGIFCRTSEVPAIVERFRRAEIDGLFIPFMDFGEEGAVLELCKAFKGLPILIWGGRDEAPNTYEKRGRDCQCGMFAATRVLRRMGVTYSYITAARRRAALLPRATKPSCGPALWARCTPSLRISRCGILRTTTGS